MIKEIIDKLVALLAVSALLASCSESELWQNPQTEARDGYIMLNFKTEIPAMQEVVTRAVDPDGGGVQDMTLFCFDSYGLFISTVKAGVTVQKPALAPKANCRKIIASEVVSFTPATSLAVSV